MPDPRPPLRAVQRAFWSALRAGVTIEEAAAGVGASVRTAHTWRRQAGGVPPLRLSAAVAAPPAPVAVFGSVQHLRPVASAVPGVPVAPDPPVAPDRPDGPRGRHLGLEERERIAVLLVATCSLRTIAVDLGRSASTISREVRAHMRHRRTRRYLPAGAVLPGPLGTLDWVTEWEYSPLRAQRRFESALARPQPTKLASNPRLRERVRARLLDHDSPEQIAARLRLDFPDEEEMWVSHETIYLSLYVQARGELRRDLTRRLRTGRAIRRPRSQSGQRSRERAANRIPGLVPISERPPEVEDRAVPGHWEGDLITGAENKSAIGTLVERTTRYVMLLHLPDGHGAQAVAETMITAISRLPEDLRRTMTWDRGIEMANHAHITAATDLDIYFCDPHSPWQRGSNENTNGLLRQYFPKGTDLSAYAPDYLEHVARQLNNRPRKTLAWHTPAEALDKLLSNPPSPTVATTP